MNLLQNNPVQPEPFTPPGQDDLEEDLRAVYLIRPPTVHDGVKIRHAARVLGGRVVPDGEMMALLTEGVEAIAKAGGEDPPKDLMGRLAQCTDFALAGQALSPDDARWLGELETVVERSYQPYREALADFRAFMENYALEAGRLQLVGWRHVPGLDARSDLAAPIGLELAARLPRGHLSALGNRVLVMLAPGAEEKKV